MNLLHPPTAISSAPSRRAHKTRRAMTQTGRWLRLLSALLALVTLSASAQIAYEAASSGAVNSNSVLTWNHTVGGLAGSP